MIAGWKRCFLKIATFRHLRTKRIFIPNHESTRFTQRLFVDQPSTQKKNMGPSTARHPTERSCVVVFCFLASSDGGTLDTAFLVYGLIGCECHELRNFSDNKNTWLTWRCFLINPQKNKAGCFQKRMLCLSVCVFNALGSLGPKLWLGYTELMAADVLLHLATWDMGHRGWWQKP